MTGWWRWSSRSLVVEIGSRDEAGAALLAQAIAVAPDGDDMAVMEQSIEDGGSERRDRRTCYPTRRLSGWR